MKGLRYQKQDLETFAPPTPISPEIARFQGQEILLFFKYFVALLNAVNTRLNTKICLH